MTSESSLASRQEEAKKPEIEKPVVVADGQAEGVGDSKAEQAGTAEESSAATELPSSENSAAPVATGETVLAEGSAEPIQSDQAEKEKSDKPAQSNKAETTEKAEKADKSGKAGKAGKSEKAGKTDKAAPPTPQMGRAPPGSAEVRRKETEGMRFSQCIPLSNAVKG